MRLDTNRRNFESNRPSLEEGTHLVFLRNFPNEPTKSGDRYAYPITFEQVTDGSYQGLQTTLWIDGGTDGAITEDFRGRGKIDRLLDCLHVAEGEEIDTQDLVGEVFVVVVKQGANSKRPSVWEVHEATEKQELEAANYMATYFPLK